MALTLPNGVDGGVCEVDDLEPQPRDRCNTWPLQKPVGDLSHHTSPLIHEEIPEEGRSRDGSGENLAGPVDPGASTKKNTARRNAWGNLSYADLITQAILSSADKRLTLSQIYDWMVQNVPYFRDKGDSNSSAGWKNSIRHNLSLHNRFMRIQNEGAGKSSWWVINPDAKPGKSSRRRAGSMEQTTKQMEKKRGRAKKKAEQMRSEGLLSGPGQAATGHLVSLSPSMSESSEQLYGEPGGGGPAGFSLSPSDFRSRSDSNLSNYSLGSACQGRLSPQLEELEDWAVSERLGMGPVGALAPLPSGPQELFSDLLESMSLGEPQLVGTLFSSPVKPQAPPPPSYTQTPVGGRPAFHSGPAGQAQRVSGGVTGPHPSPMKGAKGKMGEACGATTSPQQQQVQQQQPPSNVQVGMEKGTYRAQVSPLGFVKEEPPAYQELYPASVQSINANPMLRDALQKAQAQHNPQHGYAPNCGGQFYVHGVHGPGQLPTELSEINYYDALKSDIQCDIDQVIRHELSVAGKLDFNMDGIGNL